MAMYLELSRPAGDVSRWEKVLKRLILLNKNYPLESEKCSLSVFQRNMETVDKKRAETLFDITIEALIDQDVVFFGGYASYLFSKYMAKKFRKVMTKQPDFDVLSLKPKLTATIVKERLEQNKIGNVKIIKHEHIGEVIPEHYEVRANQETIAFIYSPIACHSYNQIEIKGRKIKIASIDTIMSLYLAFLYSGKKYYDNDRILCMASFLFDVQKFNRLKQTGLLKRFPTDCYGEQHTIDSIRTEKSEMWEKLKGSRGTKEYDMWFLNYKPTQDKNTNNKATNKANDKENKKFKQTKKTIKTLTSTSRSSSHKHKTNKTNKRTHNKSKLKFNRRQTKTNNRRNSAMHSTPRILTSKAWFK
jgi:hypothetical protein